MNGIIGRKVEAYPQCPLKALRNGEIAGIEPAATGALVAFCSGGDESESTAILMEDDGFLSEHPVSRVRVVPIRRAKPAGINPLDAQAQFEAWWALWPAGRKSGRKNAFRAFTNAVPAAVEFEELMSRTRMLVEQDYRHREKAYIPLPATFLNGDRWNDEPVPPTSRREKELTPEWAKIPAQDDALVAWAQKHGYPVAGTHMSYRQYRDFLTREVAGRLAQKELDV